eukprot:TRINITY_DN3439_c0_g1_i1.p1 TRINITY_DN3439_c0_g1~~TRINITY_DN3439_c0_g1_i1.p1  ORF type:complete len:336 (+),score=42.76 TRINITY_DN3439_c0_g1_i1:233-1240(+)
MEHVPPYLLKARSRQIRDGSMELYSADSKALMGHQDYDNDCIPMDLSALTALPTEILSDILDYVGDEDYCNARLSCTTLYTVSINSIVERRAKSALRRFAFNVWGYLANDLPAMQWIHDRFLRVRATGYFVEEEKIAMVNAAGFGRMNILKWFHTFGRAKDPSRMLEQAAGFNQIEVLDYLYELYGDQVKAYTKRSCGVAASEGYIDVLRWMHCHSIDSVFTPTTMHMAVRQGSWSCILTNKHWLPIATSSSIHHQSPIINPHAHPPPSYLDLHPESSSYLPHHHRHHRHHHPPPHRHFTIITHHSRDVLSSPNSSHQTGHLEIVKFLHEHRNLG